MLAWLQGYNSQLCNVPISCLSSRVVQITNSVQPALSPEACLQANTGKCVVTRRIVWLKPPNFISMRLWSPRFVHPAESTDRC